MTYTVHTTHYTSTYIRFIFDLNMQQTSNIIRHIVVVCGGLLKMLQYWIFDCMSQIFQLFMTARPNKKPGTMCTLWKNYPKLAINSWNKKFELLRWQWPRRTLNPHLFRWFFFFNIFACYTNMLNFPLVDMVAVLVFIC